MTLTQNQYTYFYLFYNCFFFYLFKLKINILFFFYKNILYINLIINYFKISLILIYISLTYDFSFISNFFKIEPCYCMEAPNTDDFSMYSSGSGSSRDSESGGSSLHPVDIALTLIDNLELYPNSVENRSFFFSYYTAYPYSTINFINIPLITENIVNEMDFMHDLIINDLIAVRPEEFGTELDAENYSEIFQKFVISIQDFLKILDLHFIKIISSCNGQDVDNLLNYKIKTINLHSFLSNNLVKINNNISYLNMLENNPVIYDLSLFQVNDTVSNNLINLPLENQLEFFQNNLNQLEYQENELFFRENFDKINSYNGKYQNLIRVLNRNGFDVR